MHGKSCLRRVTFVRGEEAILRTFFFSKGFNSSVINEHQVQDSFLARSACVTLNGREEFRAKTWMMRPVMFKIKFETLQGVLCTFKWPNCGME